MSKNKEAFAKIKDLPSGELTEALGKARDELFRLQLGNHTNQLENPLAVRSKRREVARIMTVMQERTLATKEA